MKIGVVGGGSVGLLVSGYLAVKHEVTIYVRREEQKEKINECFLFLNDNRTNCKQAFMMDELKDEDCLFICVKQHHIPSVIQELKHVSKNTPLIFLQNGMGHVQALEKINNPIYLGVVEHGAQRKDDHQVIQTGKGVIQLALYQGEQTAFTTFVKEVHHENFPFDKQADWEKMLHKKLLVNAVINPLTALFQIKNSGLINNPYIHYLAKKICMEVAMSLQLPIDQAWEKVLTIAEKTGANTSSMLMDVQQKRTSELESILGYLLKNSSREMPFTTFVYKGVKALEYQNGV